MAVRAYALIRFPRAGISAWQKKLQSMRFLIMPLRLALPLVIMVMKKMPIVLSLQHSWVVALPMR